MFFYALSIALPCEALIWDWIYIKAIDCLTGAFLVFPKEANLSFALFVFENLSIYFCYIVPSLFIIPAAFDGELVCSITASFNFSFYYCSSFSTLDDLLLALNELALYMLISSKLSFISDSNFYLLMLSGTPSFFTLLGFGPLDDYSSSSSLVSMMIDCLFLLDGWEYLPLESLMSIFPVPCLFMLMVICFW